MGRRSNTPIIASIIIGSIGIIAFVIGLLFPKSGRIVSPIPESGPIHVVFLTPTPGRQADVEGIGGWDNPQGQ